MKTLLTLISCLFLNFVFSQSNEYLIKESILSSINQIRLDKNLGKIDTTYESNFISSIFYKLYDKIDKDKIIFETGYSNEWASYDYQKFTLNISKSEKNVINLVDSVFKILISKYNYTHVKWFSFDNNKYSKPIILGICVTNKTSDYQKSYLTYDVIITSIKNVPELEKCVLSNN
jgi:hypothetical protein